MTHDDRTTCVFVTHRDLRTAVALMERSLDAAREGALKKAGNLFPIDSGDAAAITELEQVVKKFRKSVTEANQ